MSIARRSSRRAGLLALAACAALTLGGCTGIPDSSAPQTVEPIQVGDSAGASVGPQRNVGPRAIVTGFLDAGAADVGTVTAARSFLTPAARNQWSGLSAKIIAGEQVQTYQPDRRTVTVTGRLVGTLNSNGIYSPAPPGSGVTQFEFVLKQVSGQYRIDELPAGLLITTDQFAQNYQQHIVYYYDLTAQSLVPDLRWTAIPVTDPARLANWLLDQLVQQPRPELADAVDPDTFPAQDDPTRVFAKLEADTMRVEIPGSTQLAGADRDRLAAQIANTLTDALSGSITITDGGVPVRIPAAHGTSFGPSTFPLPSLGPNGVPPVYFLQSGRLLSQAGTPVPGQLGGGSLGLTSVAVQHRATGAAAVAAVTGTGGGQRLSVGATSGSLQASGVGGQLTRPSWAPGLPEVWIGDGSTLDRVVTGGSSPRVVAVPITPLVGSQPIVSVRISPDGSQVALVLGQPNNAQLYVGAIVRDSGTVRVLGLTEISPPNVVVQDADWSSPQKLVAVGYPTSTTIGSYYETEVDGSFWTDSKGTVGLPDRPVDITASNYGVWTEAGSQIWYLNGTVWRSPSPTGQQFGSAPVYEV